MLRAVRIVHLQNRGLFERRGRAEAMRMIRIAFDFGGTPVVGFDQEPRDVAAHRMNRRVEKGLAGRVVFRVRSVEYGNNVFDRTAASSEAR